jgi:hypothetical protein
MRFTSSDMVPLTIMVPRNLVPCVRGALKLVRPSEREAFGTDPVDLIQSEARYVLNLIFSVVECRNWAKFEALVKSYGFTDEEKIEVPA